MSAASSSPSVFELYVFDLRALLLTSPNQNEISRSITVHNAGIYFNSTIVIRFLYLFFIQEIKISVFVSIIIIIIIIIIIHLLNNLKMNLKTKVNISFLKCFILLNNMSIAVI